MKMKKIVLASGLGLLAGMSTVAQAATPAGIIRNTATLNYAGITTALEATVDVTISLVPSAPNVVKVTADQTTANGTAIAAGQGASYTYHVTSSANGGDTYSITTAEVAGPGGVTPDAGSQVSISSVILGSTSAAFANLTPATTIKVPFDGGDGSTSINGLIVTDTVVLNISGTTGTTEYEIAGIAQSPADVVAGLVTITLDAAVVIGVGDQLLERETFTMSISDVGEAAGSIYTDVESFVTSNTGLTSGTVQAITDVTVPGFIKVVRNASIANGTGTATECGGVLSTDPTPYYDSGVNATPGQTLEYCIQVEPDSNISGANVSDTFPPFTAFTPGSGLKFGTAGTFADPAGTSFTETVQSLNGASPGDVVGGEPAGIIYQLDVEN